MKKTVILWHLFAENYSRSNYISAIVTEFDGTDTNLLNAYLETQKKRFIGSKVKREDNFWDVVEAIPVHFQII